MSQRVIESLVQTSVPSEELNEKYYDRMPVFLVEDIWKDKYVDDVLK